MKTSLSECPMKNYFSVAIKTTSNGKNVVKFMQVDYETRNQLIRSGKVLFSDGEIVKWLMEQK